MTLPDRMNGVVLTGHGGPEKLQWRDDLPVERPNSGDVIIRVKAAGVNNTDINTRTGWYSKGNADAGDGAWSGAPLTFPRIQGADVCGQIVEVGDGVAVSRIGERVLVEPCLREVGGKVLETPWYFGSECDGGVAQYTRVASRHAHAVHSSLSDKELASFPCSYSTAENMLTRANVQAGEVVLITGASGGVGSAAVQLARARSANVIAVTSPSKALALSGMGAQTTLDRKDNVASTLGANSVDVIIDLVAGPNWSTLFDVLRPGGRYAVAGAIGGAHVTLDVRTLYLKDLSFFGCTILDEAVFNNLVKRIERNEIRPLVAETHPLHKLELAQRRFGQKNFVGKIVLEVE